MNNIIKKLQEFQDPEYKEFQAKLIPNRSPNQMIGVRTPDLRKYAKELYKGGNYQSFLKELPHKYFDEDQLHAFILSEMKDYIECVESINQFLPYVDNWATCDQMSPKVFKKHHKELIVEIKKWLQSKKTYTIRFGIGMLMQHYLDEDFKEEYLEWVSKIKSEEYYVNMMIAWYYATALAKQYEATIPYLEKNILEKWTHNKTIQKAIESYRITPEQKEYLRSIKR